MVRIEPSDGRVTRIGLPSVNDTSRFSTVAWPDRTLLHSATSANYFVVHDDGTSERLPVRSHQGPIYPGPEPGLVWLPDGKGRLSDYILRSIDREQPEAHYSWATDVLGSDLRGNLLVRLAGDVYSGKTTECGR